MAEGDIDKAEELSDRLATREVSGLLKAFRKKKNSFGHLGCFYFKKVANKVALKIVGDILSVS